MTVKLALISIFTAILMALGQLLFKLGADNIQQFTNLPNYLYQIVSSGKLISACVIYALAIFIWVWALTQAPLSRIYPFTALAYVLTPLFAYLILDEKVNLQFLLGTLLLLAGIIISTTAQASVYVDH
jgi:drug/metabolite transporter (DMT)-like permease